MSFYGNTDFLFEVAKGNVPGHTLSNITAANFDVDAGVIEDVWNPGGTMDYPVANELWEVVSDDINDALGGTGAHSVRITYLDDTYTVQPPETVDLNGTTPVPLIAINCFRPELIEVVAIGSTGSNVGNITLQRVSDSAPRDGIGPTENVSGNSHKTIPAGKTGHLFLVSGFVGKNKDIIVRTRMTNGTDGVFRTIYGIALYQQSLAVPLNLPGGPILEKTDIKMVCQTENNNTEVGVIIQFLLVDN